MIRILFVCTGNTCRSPMAEAILKSKKIPDVEVKSAGIFAANGSTASLHAQKVLEEQKIIGYDHRSSPLTMEKVEWATYILTMTSNHKNSIISMFPGAREKTYTLEEFAGKTNGGDISDPFGGSLETYRNTYNEINKSIDKLIKRITNEVD